MGTSIRPALPFTGTSSVSSTSSVSTDTHATPANGACRVNAAFSPGRNGSARRSILNVVSLTTGSWAAASPVTVVSSLTTGALTFVALTATTYRPVSVVGKTSWAGVFDSCDATFANWSVLR